MADLVPAGRPCADIGTDHGALPTWLVLAGRVPRAVAVDDKEGPLATARRRVERLGLQDRVALRRAWGCAALDEEVRTVTIAGMGGPLMARILADAPPGVTRLVLQPNVGERGLRAWLARHGWVIDAERAVLDRGRWFAVFAAGRARAAEAADLDEVALTYGRPALHLDPDALRGRLVAELGRLDALLAEAVGSRGQSSLDAQRAVVLDALRLTPGA